MLLLDYRGSFGSFSEENGLGSAPSGDKHRRGSGAVITVHDELTFAMNSSNNEVTSDVAVEISTMVNENVA